MQGLVDTKPKHFIWKWMEWINPYLQVRPATGSLPLDIVYLLVLVAFQHAILAQITGQSLLINMVGVWLVANAILLPLGSSLAICLLGGFLIETYGMVPMGIYMTTYWVVAAVIYLVRDSLSWRHLSPWLASGVLAELWVIGFESLTIGVEQHYRFQDVTFYLTAILRVGFTAGMTVAAFRLWRKRVPLEGVS